MKKKLFLLVLCIAFFTLSGSVPSKAAASTELGELSSIYGIEFVTESNHVSNLPVAARSDLRFSNSLYRHVETTKLSTNHYDKDGSLIYDYALLYVSETRLFEQVKSTYKPVGQTAAISISETVMKGDGYTWGVTVGIGVEVEAVVYSFSAMAKGYFNKSGMTSHGTSTNVEFAVSNTSTASSYTLYKDYKKVEFIYVYYTANEYQHCDNFFHSIFGHGHELAWKTNYGTFEAYHGVSQVDVTYSFRKV